MTSRLNNGVTATIRNVANEAELEQLYRLRAEVFFGEDILSRDPTTRLTDHLDRCPSTVNLVAVNNQGAVVGGVRVTMPDGDLVPARTPYFDFVRYLPAEGRTSGSGSMLCLRPDLRGTALATLLIRSAMLVSVSSGCSRLCAAVRPAVAPLLERLGWIRVADDFYHPVEFVPVSPMVVAFDRDGLVPRLSASVERMAHLCRASIAF